MAAQDSLGVFKILWIPPLPQEERGFDDIPCIVDLAAVRVDSFSAAFNDPAQSITYVFQPVVIESANPLIKSALRVRSANWASEERTQVVECVCPPNASRS